MPRGTRERRGGTRRRRINDVALAWSLNPPPPSMIRPPRLSMTPPPPCGTRRHSHPTPAITSLRTTSAHHLQEARVAQLHPPVYRLATLSTFSSPDPVSFLSSSSSCCFEKMDELPGIIVAILLLFFAARYVLKPRSPVAAPVAAGAGGDASITPTSGPYKGVSREMVSLGAHGNWRRRRRLPLPAAGSWLSSPAVCTLGC